MIIMGIDPGFAITGYGVVKYEGNKFTQIGYGAITTDSGLGLPSRLLILYNELEQLILKYNPEVIAIEELFFNKNVKTGILVGQGRGVIILCAAKAGIQISEYTPLQIKQSIVGYGEQKRHRYSIWLELY